MRRRVVTSYALLQTMLDLLLFAGLASNLWIVHSDHVTSAVFSTCSHWNLAWPSPFTWQISCHASTSKAEEMKTEVSWKTSNHRARLYKSQKMSEITDKYPFYVFGFLIGLCPSHRRPPIQVLVIGMVALILLCANRQAHWLGQWHKGAKLWARNFPQECWTLDKVLFLLFSVTLYPTALSLIHHTHLHSILHLLVPSEHLRPLPLVLTISILSVPSQPLYPSHRKTQTLLPSSHHQGIISKKIKR